MKITTVAKNLIYVICLKQPYFLKVGAVSRITVCSTAQLVSWFYKPAKASGCSYCSLLQAEEVDTSHPLVTNRTFVINLHKLRFLNVCCCIRVDYPERNFRSIWNKSEMHDS